MAVLVQALPQGVQRTVLGLEDAMMVQQSAEEMVRRVLRRRRQGVGAIEVARQLGWPWRIVARLMQRMADRGQLSLQIVEHRDRRSRVRTQRTYSVIEITRMPGWLVPFPAPLKTPAEGPNRSKARRSGSG
jgi:hypothetical protein